VEVPASDRALTFVNRSFAGHDSRRYRRFIRRHHQNPRVVGTIQRNNILINIAPAERDCGVNHS